MSRRHGCYTSVVREVTCFWRDAVNSMPLLQQVAMKFEEMIDRVKVPLALIYGKEDPWVVPLWGHRIKRQRPETLYYQV